MRIEIPEPCSQKWGQMTYMDDSTRFCAECSKNIIDFSNQTNEQILNFMRSKPIDVCGKFSKNQLKRELGKNDFAFPGLKAMLLASTLSQFYFNSNSQVLVNKTEIQQQKQTDSNHQVIRGEISDSSYLISDFQLKIELLDLNLFCYPDIDGNFQFNVLLDSLPNSISLKISKGNSYKIYKDLNPNEFIQIQDSFLPIEIDSNFIQETQLIGFVVVKPKWYQFGFKFRRLWYRLWH
jgi:hypothetical protein